MKIVLTFDPLTGPQDPWRSPGHTWRIPGVTLRLLRREGLECRVVVLSLAYLRSGLGESAFSS